MDVSDVSISKTSIVFSLADVDDTTNNRKRTNHADGRPIQIIPSSASSTTSATSDDSSFDDSSSITISNENNDSVSDTISQEEEQTRKYNVSRNDESRQRPTIWNNALFQTGLSLMVWSGIISVPLLLSSPYSPISYKDVFPSEMYEVDPTSQYAKPFGIFLSIFSIGFGHFLMLLFCFVYRTYGNPIPIQTRKVSDYNFWQGALKHASQPKPNIVLGSYLLITWFYKLLPSSYYSFHGTIQFHYVFPCLLIQDFVEYCMHRVVHSASGALYRYSHKPHHQYINPILFDTFKGTIPDTILTVLLPLTIMTQVMRNCNIWTYMAFGCIDISWGTLIHSEYYLPWDYVFEKIKFGTAADHHVHHIFFNYNYGHIFMYWDVLFGTYRSPKSFGTKTFNLPQEQQQQHDKKKV